MNNRVKSVLMKAVALTLALFMLGAPALSGLSPVWAAPATEPSATAPETTLPEKIDYTTKAENILLYCIEADAVIYGKNETASFPPYALTKLVSALVAVENIADIHEPFTIEASMLERFSNSYGYAEGDTTCPADLLRLMILRGFDDAACILGRRIAGSDEAYVKMLNEKAAELGAADTLFANTTGRNDAGKTTAIDAAKIGAAVTKNRGIMEIAGSGDLRLETNDKRIYNRNYFLSIYYNASGKQYLDSRVSGLIAGSVLDPRMLIASINVGDYTYLAVVMNAAEDDGCAFAYEIVSDLVRKNSDIFHYVRVLSPADLICEIPVNMGEGHDVVVAAPDRSFAFHLRKDSDPSVEFRRDFQLDVDVLEAPVLANTKVGTLILYRGGVEVGRADLRTVANVGRSTSDYYRSEAEKKLTSRFFYKVMLVIAALAVIYVLVVAIYRGQKKKRRRNATGH